MTMADIRALEDKTKEELEKKRAEGEVCGTKPLSNWRWSEKEEASNERKLKLLIRFRTMWSKRYARI